MEIVIWVVWAISLVATGVHGYHSGYKSGYTQGSSKGYDVGYKHCLVNTKDYLIKMEEEGKITIHDTEA